MRGFDAEVEVLTKSWLGRLSPFFTKDGLSRKLKCRAEFRAYTGQRVASKALFKRVFFTTTILILLSKHFLLNKLVDAASSSLASAR